MDEERQRSILIAGATGLIGRQLLKGLIADETAARIIAIGRTKPPETHYKLTFETVDFGLLPRFPPLTECYIALGTTIKDAGSQRSFRAIDYDAVVRTAEAAWDAGARKLGVVSAMGAGKDSSIFYSRVKGEMEDALAKLNFDTLVIARPSMLAGDRAAVGQRVRRGEVVALKLSRWFRRFIPPEYQSVRAESVARALLQAVPTTEGHRVMLSSELRDY
jgi:uncharacterized protein YbjT (DUF2867 family)